MLAALACVAAGMTPAQAGLRKCDSRTMIAADYAAMKNAATKAAEGHVLDWHQVRPCMNPGSGLVWIDGKQEPQPDGSRHEILATCQRAKGPWGCEVDVSRYLAFSLMLKDHEQKFDILLLHPFAVDDARRFVARAFEKAATLKARDNCGAKPNEAPTQWDLDEERTLADAIAPTESPIRGTIRQDAESIELLLFDIGIKYSRVPDAVDEKTFQCWTAYVVVT